MADRYLLESGAPDGYLLEDGSGVLLLETVSAVQLYPYLNAGYYPFFLLLVVSWY